ncbi:N-acetylmuramoyl-L-alanine amidase [Prevotella sp. E9-3]|uniref:N-acetylmuramoyl-L-alanine amidase n=1 Tax=Prevotella sp. E9-3 TaxID=2913621 RepID=UPI001EDB74BB|nr:N-acetylmuramoyl-L-alanine amidase [Prevotella sp. E9-3]UKK48496.1 N-acetylmuramoyl-L-alanine amidase [Prevotella sp. E9-3]
MKQTMRRIDRIIVHCTATPEGRHVTVKDVDSWHRDRGWANGIGYHYLIYLDGSIFFLRVYLLLLNRQQRS